VPWGREGRRGCKLSALHTIEEGARRIIQKERKKENDKHMSQLSHKKFQDWFFNINSKSLKCQSTLLFLSLLRNIW
jgi:hypothetical protein